MRRVLLPVLALFTVIAVLFGASPAIAAATKPAQKTVAPAKVHTATTPHAKKTAKSTKKSKSAVKPASLKKSKPAARKHSSRA